MASSGTSRRRATSAAGHWPRANNFLPTETGIKILAFHNCFRLKFSLENYTGFGSDFDSFLQVRMIVSVPFAE